MDTQFEAPKSRSLTMPARKWGLLIDVNCLIMQPNATESADTHVAIGRVVELATTGQSTDPLVDIAFTDPVNSRVWSVPWSLDFFRRALIHDDF
jgi:hypothetical protein